MQIVADLHTHTIASGHAADTIRTVCETAARRGLLGVAITDHGPMVPGGADKVYFMALQRMVDAIDVPIRVMSGIEDDIINARGELSMGEEIVGRLEIVKAGCHPFAWIAEQSMKVRTDALLNAIALRRFRVFTHPVGSYCDFDIDAVVEACAEAGIALELNESKIDDVRKNRSFLELCAKLNAYITVSSDAHVAEEVGGFERSLSILETVGFPESLVINTSTDKIASHFGISWKKG
ncbi:MAG: PHP domain-containing protein [Spirochaetes bacterium]|nr:PHP domain-containing protein [Spirochaetota bacterium]